MKLLLTSAGFTTDTIVATCESLVGKSADQINVAVINEAYVVELEDHSWVIEELALLREKIGGTLSLVNLLALDDIQIEKIMKNVDVIYVVGGHTDYLMSVFRKTGFASRLPHLLADKVYVGSSAGSMVMCNRVSTESYKRIYGEGESYGAEKYLGLVDLAIKPHLNSPEWLNNRKEVLLEIAQDYNGTLYGLSDTSAIVINDSTISIVGEDWVKIVDGELV